MKILFVVLVLALAGCVTAKEQPPVVALNYYKAVSPISEPIHVTRNPYPETNIELVRHIDEGTLRLAGLMIADKIQHGLQKEIRLKHVVARARNDSAKAVDTDLRVQGIIGADGALVDPITNARTDLEKLQLIALSGVAFPVDQQVISNGTVLNMEAAELGRIELTAKGLTSFNGREALLFDLTAPNGAGDYAARGYVLVDIATGETVSARANYHCQVPGIGLRRITETYTVYTANWP